MTLGDAVLEPTVILLAAALCGCCVTPTHIPYQDAREVPAMMYGTPAAGTGKVTFVRDYCGGMNLPHPVDIDGMVVARLRGGDKVSTYLPEGTYGFSTGFWNIESQVKAGQAVIYNLQDGSAVRSVEKP